MAEKKILKAWRTDGHLEIYKWLLIHNVERRLFDTSVGKRVKVEQEQQVASCFTRKMSKASKRTSSKPSSSTTRS